MEKMNCLRCGSEMNYLTRENIQLGKTGWVLGDFPNLIAGALKTDIYVCPQCRKLEFFAAEDEVSGDDIPKRTCPVCNTVHDFDYPKCPKCKYDYYSK